LSEVLARRLLFCLFVARVAAAQATPAPINDYRARVLGTFDGTTGEPIEGVEVTDVLSGLSAFTTRTGTVSLVFLPPGNSAIRVRKVGYAAILRVVSIGPADTVPITLILTRALPAMITADSSPRYISPGLRAFEERRKGGFGQFIAEAELRKADNREMSDVLRKLTGFKISCSTRTPRRCVATAGCAPTLIFIDGVRSTDNNLLMLRVSEFAAVEAYHGATIPVEYNMTGSACGVLLFWSRER
jgi:hypothetical protein